LNKTKGCLIANFATVPEKAALVPVRTLSVGWVSSVDELEREVIREALEHGAAAYLISELEQARFVHARATLFA